MKTLIMFFIFILSIPIYSLAEDTTIYDSGYGGKKIGRIDESGTIYNDDYHKLGHVDESGVVYDRSYRKKGRITEDGRLYDSFQGGEKVGEWREKDGRMFDDSHRPVGQVDDKRGSGYFILDSK